MDATTRQALLSRFAACLDAVDGEPDLPEDERPEADVYAVFVELAALRGEVRAETRLVKEALDQVRGVFDPLRAGHAALEQALRRTEDEAAARTRAAVKSLLLDLLDLRDRLQAGLAALPADAPRSLCDRLLRRPAGADPATWREGFAMTLRRLDRILADRGVTPVAAAGRPFDPRSHRAVGSVEDPARPDGLVVAELRAGFLWEDAVLRPAEVTVNKHAAAEAAQEARHGSA